MALIGRLGCLGLMFTLMANSCCAIVTPTENSVNVKTTTEPYTSWPDWTTTAWWYWTSSPPPVQDLTDMMFSVMSGSAVTFHSSPHYQDINALTACLRIVSEYQPGSSIFTLSIRNSPILALRFMGNSGYELTVGQASRRFSLVSDNPSFGKLWPWTSLCVTWSSRTGMTQVWRDGKMSVRKGMWRGQYFQGPPVMTLSGFEGQVTDIHVWDRALPFSSLRTFNQGWGYPSGNLLSWRGMSYTSDGYAILENTYVSQGELAEKERFGKEEQKEQRRQWRKHRLMGNGVPGEPEEGQGCLGPRKRCGRRQVL